MSEAQRKSAKKITTTTVMIVVLKTSVRVGQETFFISCTTSRQNWRTFAIQPRGFETNGCLFGSSANAAAPSRVLDDAIANYLNCRLSELNFSDARVKQGNKHRKRAGVSGFEPELSVLETDVLTVNTIPLYSKIVDRSSIIWSPCEPYAYGKNDRTS